LEEATAQSISGNPLNILMANNSIFRNEFTMIQVKYLLEFWGFKCLFLQMEGTHKKLINQAFWSPTLEVFLKYLHYNFYKHLGS